MKSWPYQCGLSTTVNVLCQGLTSIFENDRVRYTISPDARKEVLKRLLKLNHEIHEQEVKVDVHAKGKSKKKKTDSSKQIKLF